MFAGVLMVIPFGSYSALQRYVVDGSIVKTVSQGRFIVTDNDDRSYMSWQITALKQSAPQRPTVYLLGGSPMRACILSTATLAKALNPRQATLVGAKMPASSARTVPSPPSHAVAPPTSSRGSTCWRCAAQGAVAERERLGAEGGN